jgi:hypothetical protein
MKNHKMETMDVKSNKCGCWTDDPGNRTLQGMVWREQHEMTHELCFGKCSGLNYTFYGVEYGSECR